MRELPAYGGADLRHLLGPAQPIKPGHQRRVQARRDGQGRRRHRSNCPHRRALAFRLEGRLGHLFHEQGNAVATLDDVVPDICWQQFVADDAVNHRGDIALCQPIDRRSGYVWLSDPGWVEFRPECYDQQDGKGPNPVHNPTEHLQTRGIGPVRILEDHQHRIGAR